jgi:hypothetical protein
MTSWESLYSIKNGDEMKILAKAILQAEKESSENPTDAITSSISRAVVMNGLDSTAASLISIIMLNQKRETFIWWANETLSGEENE